MVRIPFNRPFVSGRALEYMTQALSSGHQSGDGPFTKACHVELQALCNVPKALLTTSCTHALEMSALLLNIEPGDEVILPSFTFVSTANAYVLRGAKPVFCDIRKDTLNLDESKLEGLITPRTKAIVVVHYAGVGCDMAPILEIASSYGIPVVEDNAHGLFGSYEGKPLGSFGTFATQSFHETKNVSCGEGGALLISNESNFERAEILREKGTNRSRFFRGQVDKYTWVDVGSSFLPSDILAAVLAGNLESSSEIQTERATIWKTYEVALADWASKFGIGLPHVPGNCDQAYHMFYLLMPDLESRTKFISDLRDQGIVAPFHYLPLHLSDMGRGFGGTIGQCPVTENISDRLVRLPFYNRIGPAQEEVIDAVRAFRPATVGSLI